MREIILINVSGEDRPGLTASLTEVLSQYKITVLDMSQAVIHDTLSLGILVEVPREAESSPILKDLLFKAHNLGVDLKFTPVSEEDYEEWVAVQGRQRHIITLLGRRIQAGDIAAIARVIADNGLNIDGINRLSGRISFRNPNIPRACIELSVRGTPQSTHDMRARFMAISREHGVDIALQEDNVYRRNRKLVAFDMDSTLIQWEVIDELAKRAGAGQEVAAITESAMRGEIDFKQSLTLRVAQLEGLEESVLKDLAGSIPLTEGAQRLIANLKQLGYKVAILSGGFTYFGRVLQERLGIDYVYANELEIEDGRLTGRIKGEIVDGPRKAALLKEIAGREHISLEQVIAVGDGANDLPMLDIAGLGIAFHAKPVVTEGAEQSISSMGLDAILYFLGLRDRETLECAPVTDCFEETT